MHHLEGERDTSPEGLFSFMYEPLTSASGSDAGEKVILVRIVL